MESQIGSPWKHDEICRNFLVKLNDRPADGQAEKPLGRRLLAKRFLLLLSLPGLEPSKQAVLWAPWWRSEMGCSPPCPVALVVELVCLCFLQPPTSFLKQLLVSAQVEGWLRPERVVRWTGWFEVWEAFPSGAPGAELRAVERSQEEPRGTRDPDLFLSLERCSPGPAWQEVFLGLRRICALSRSLLAEKRTASVELSRPAPGKPLFAAAPAQHPLLPLFPGKRLSLLPPPRGLVFQSSTPAVFPQQRGCTLELLAFSALLLFPRNSLRMAK